MREGEYVDSLISLIDEYETLLIERLRENTNSEYDETEILKELSVSADWNISAAREIVNLAEEYDAFMLHNALAVAVVLGKEDGSAGFDFALSVRAIKIFTAVQGRRVR
jgi:hypothetical protein